MVNSKGPYCQQISWDEKAKQTTACKKPVLTKHSTSQKQKQSAAGKKPVSSKRLAPQKQKPLESPPHQHSDVSLRSHITPVYKEDLPRNSTKGGILNIPSHQSQLSSHSKQDNIPAWVKWGCYTLDANTVAMEKVMLSCVHFMACIDYYFCRHMSVRAGMVKLFSAFMWSETFSGDGNMLYSPSPKYISYQEMVDIVKDMRNSIEPQSDRVGASVEVINAGRERYQLQLQDVKKPSLLSLPVDHYNPPDPLISWPSKPSSGNKHTSDGNKGEEPSTDEDLTICPAYHKKLKTPQGLISYLSSTKSCKQYNKWKLQSLTIPGELDRGNDLEIREVPDMLPDKLRPMDEDPEDVVDD
ncbi:hypothetical protein SERLA73DRAFT_68275 [Serpula lacrymans var. lacrymans S7.3]|uniref:Uncharacterized protein n=2 Tax=Serpula lacrymans var. lacrymans TaxID=341189 RepID=F8PHV4_SERL3|nr:uncharacterized protein SERLADRAFT_432017 [Serpula lacrymans var. lacrymans S7.9]EGO04583.1 hypothetical protein SERLA73DRAFT_68275 [Serpula lacrymans var. lacrymans S7.3]EGO30458.1 hypothetical protein SERLADRAFT_432017 [Serpula lacrymans var. lacrymans S7.9]